MAEPEISKGDDLPPIVSERALRKRWAPDRDRTTWWRWRRVGKGPAPDAHLPDGPGWRRETVLAHESRMAEKDR